MKQPSRGSKVRAKMVDYLGSAYHAVGEMEILISSPELRKNSEVIEYDAAEGCGASFVSIVEDDVVQ